MGCLEPEDKRTIIDESDLEVTRLVVNIIMEAIVASTTWPQIKMV